MLRFVARRVALTIPVLLGVATLVFSLIHLIPGDPAQAMLGEAAPEVDVARCARQLGLDRPLLEQYAVVSRRAWFAGDLGTSLRTGTPVARTDRRASAGDVRAGAGGDARGDRSSRCRSASRRRCGAGTCIDHAAMTVALAGMSIPNFWLGPLLAIVFAVELGWLPVSGRGGVEHLVLPAVSLGAGAGGDARADDARVAARRTARAVRAGRPRPRRLARRALSSSMRFATV